MTYIVHTADSVGAGGVQRCVRCGDVLRVSGAFYPAGARVAVSKATPLETKLIERDALVAGEEPCRL